MKIDTKTINRYYTDYKMTLLLPRRLNKNLPILECAPRGSYSLIKSLTLPQTLELFKHNHDGIMVYLGRCNLCMIDVDNKNDKNGSLDLERLNFTDEELRTFTTTTRNNGRHYIYTSTDYLVTQLTSKCRGLTALHDIGESKGIELLTLAPTSIPPTTGYEFIIDTKPVPIPARVVDTLINDFLSKEAKKHLTIIPDNKVKKGNRNRQLNAKLFMWLKEEKSGVATPMDILQKALEISNSFVEPLSRDEVQSVVKSVYKAIDKIYNATALDEIASEGRQRLIADRFITIMGETIFYTKGFGFCLYDHESGCWKINQDLKVSHSLISNFLESLLNKKREQLDATIGKEIKAWQGVIGDSPTNEELTKAIQETPEDDNKMQREIDKKIRKLKTMLDTKDGLERRYSKALQPFIKMGEDTQIRGISNFVKAGTMGDDNRFINNSPLLLQFTNCTYDLEIGKARAHYHGDYIDYPGRCAYDPDAKCPEFDNFIKQITKGNRGLAEYLQMIIGYSATGLKDGMQKIFIFSGSGGNGKGVLCGAISNILGETMGAWSPGTFLANNTGNNNPLYDMANNANKRLLLLPELPSGVSLDRELLKRISGDDEVRARHPKQGFFTFKIKAKTIITANQYIRLGDGPSIARRLVVVPFLQQFKTDDMIEEERDLGIIDFDETIKQDGLIESKLKQEASGIANWIIEGYEIYKKHEGQQPFDSLMPDIVSQTTRDYLSQTSPIAQFLRENYQIWRNPDIATMQKMDEHGMRLKIDDLTKTINSNIASKGKEYKSTRVRNTLEAMGVKITRIREEGIRVYYAYIETKDRGEGFVYATKNGAQISEREVFDPIDDIDDTDPNMQF